MDVDGVELIVNAVVGKSLKKQPGCNAYIFDKVRERVWKEVEVLVLKGTSQLDAILTQKKRLQAIFTSEKLAYDLTQKDSNDGKSPAADKKADIVENIVSDDDVDDDEVIIVEKKHPMPEPNAIERKSPVDFNKAPTTFKKPVVQPKKPPEKKAFTMERKSLLEEKKPPLIIKEIKGMVNGEVNAKFEKKEEKIPDEKPEKPSAQTRQYFDYLAEYKNDADVYDRVKGEDIRGKAFPVSNDGACPRCNYKSNVFVVLDFLFPAGDMPEILHYLLTLGKAVLWSSKENMNCKSPPIFLCQGRCPADINKCGYNINWITTDIDKIFLFPQENFKEDRKSKISENKAAYESAEDVSSNIVASNGSSTSDDNSDYNAESSEEEYDEGEVDIDYYKKKISWVVLDQVAIHNTADAETSDEDAIIRNMLALEEARFDFTNGEMRKKTNKEVTEEIKDKTELNGNKDIIKNRYMELQNQDQIKSKSLLPLTTEKSTEKSIVCVNGKKVTVDEILNDINNRLKSRDPNHISAITTDKSKMTSSYNNTNNTSTTTNKVFNKVVAAAYAIGQQSTPQSQTVVQTKTVTAPTPTHILKGATYYDETKESKSKSSKPAFTAHDFPISKDGVCPYCHSTDVVYIILQEDGDSDELPELLEKLYNEGKAVKRKKGEYDLPSFQCKGCTYGFNLDWKSTNLEKIFVKTKVQTSVYNNNQMVSSTSYGYNSSMGQYMYNAFSQPYAQQANAAAFAMNTFGYMRPIVGTMTPFATPFQTMAGAFPNYMQQAFTQSNLQTAAATYAAYSQQSYADYYQQTPSTMQYQFPPPPYVSTYQAGQPSAMSAEYTTATNSVTNTIDTLSSEPLTTEAGADDMEVDLEDASAGTSDAVSKPDVTDDTNPSSGELYDPFADEGEEQPVTEEPQETSNEIENNSNDNDDKTLVTPVDESSKCESNPADQLADGSEEQPVTEEPQDISNEIENNSNDDDDKTAVISVDESSKCESNPSEQLADESEEQPMTEEPQDITNEIKNNSDGNDDKTAVIPVDESSKCESNPLEQLADESEEHPVSEEPEDIPNEIENNSNDIGNETVVTPNIDKSSKCESNSPPTVLVVENAIEEKLDLTSNTDSASGEKGVDDDTVSPVEGSTGDLEISHISSKTPNNNIAEGRRMSSRNKICTVNITAISPQEVVNSNDQNDELVNESNISDTEAGNSSHELTTTNLPDDTTIGDDQIESNIDDKKEIEDSVDTTISDSEAAKQQFDEDSDSEVLSVIRKKATKRKAPQRSTTTAAAKRGRGRARGKKKK